MGPAGCCFKRPVCGLLRVTLDAAGKLRRLSGENGNARGKVAGADQIVEQSPELFGSKRFLQENNFDA
jgi:hypothetical protein